VTERIRPAASVTFPTWSRTFAPAGLLDLGDNQYDDGSLLNFQAVYDPTFGRQWGRLFRPSGNAEYATLDGQGFFDYFSSTGARAGSTRAV